jgi:hypothetical protein
MTTPKQFGRGNSPVPFEINGELFHAVPDIPADSVIHIFNKYKGVGSVESGTRDHDAMVGTLKDLLSEFLYDDSYTRLVKGMGDKESPIGLGTLTEVIQWLLGDVYGLNPTQG